MVRVEATGSVDRTILALKDMGTRVSKMKSTALRIAALSCIEACADQTPVRSGCLLSNWRIGANGPSDTYDSSLKDKYEAKVDALIVAGKPQHIARIPRTEAGPIRAQVMQQAERDVLEIDRDKNVSRAVVYNPAPYAPAVDNGSSTNAPAQMTEAGREAASTALASFQFNRGTDVYHSMQQSVRIGQRKAGE